MGFSLPFWSDFSMYVYKSSWFWCHYGLIVPEQFWYHNWPEADGLQNYAEKYGILFVLESWQPEQLFSKRVEHAIHVSDTGVFEQYLECEWACKQEKTIARPNLLHSFYIFIPIDQTKRFRHSRILNLQDIQYSRVQLVFVILAPVPEG